MEPTRVAVVAVHGIGPAQRYALQDEVAENLAARLPGEWEKNAFFPPSGDGMEALNQGSALRLERTDQPNDVMFDVYEGYWSPIDKNKTSVASVLSWLTNALFAPLNAITPLPARGKKLAFDLGYVAVAVVLVFALPLAALLTLTASYADVSVDRFAGRDVSPLQALLNLRANIHILRYGLEVHYILALLLGAAGWYVIAHVVASMLFSRKGAQKLGTFRWQHKMRLFAIAVGVALISVSWSMPAIEHSHFEFRWESLLLLAVALLIRAAIALAKDFFVNRLGDIQIYSNGDYNSSHFYLRQRILDAVRGTLGRVLAAEENGKPYYERVYVVAHSLGSTIAMDALIHIRQAVEAGELSKDAWDRIKAFVTLGTALEKTKFFFGARNPTLTESFQHWRDDVYGRLFTRDPSYLTDRLEIPAGDRPIFWANYWYFRDVVANRIVTYRALSEDGMEHGVCYNVRLRERGRTVFDRPWVHSDYLGDPHFWDGVDFAGKTHIGVLDILTSKPALAQALAS